MDLSVRVYRIRLSAEEPDRGGFSDHVAIHGLEKISANRPCRQIQLCIERVEFEDIVVWRGAWRRARRLKTTFDSGSGWTDESSSDGTDRRVSRKAQRNNRLRNSFASATGR
jgi:hypothetical protein